MKDVYCAKYFIDKKHTSAFFGGTRKCDFKLTKNKQNVGEKKVQDWAGNRKSNDKYCTAYNKADQYSWADVPCKQQKRRMLCETANDWFALEKPKGC